MGPSSQGGKSFWFFCPDALPCTRRCSCWVPAVRGGSFCFVFARTHFLACQGVAGGSQQSGGESFFLDALPCVRRCSWWVPAVRGANHFFPDALPRVRRCSWWVPVVRGANRFFCRTHFLACEDVAGRSQQSGGNIFSRNTVAHPVDPCCQV